MADLLMPPFKEMKQEESGVKLNDLPELPFEKILGYLSLEDRIKSRAVSRRWCNVIDSFKPTSLFYSEWSKGFIHRKNRWISGTFAHNFISSFRFESFFQTFGHSILAKLKHLRLFELKLNQKIEPAFFFQTLASFDRLEELGLFSIHNASYCDKEFQLNLPMLKSVQFEGLRGIEKLTLDAPRLQIVKLECALTIELVHNEPVEKLITTYLYKMEVKKLKNLKYIYYCGCYPEIDSTLLSTLEHLNEIHLIYQRDVEGIFEQKKRYGRSNLKIFLLGLELNSQDDPAIGALDSNEGYLGYLAEHSSKLAEEILSCEYLQYSAINGALKLGIDLLNRFTDLTWMGVSEPIQDVDRFLNLLKNLDSSLGLSFQCDQPQELFDRLPDYYAIQLLEIGNAPASLDFVFKLKSLIHLPLWFPVDIEFVLKVLEELPFLSHFRFEYLTKPFIIKINHSRRFTVSFGVDSYGEELYKHFSDLNSVLQLIVETAQHK